MSTPARKDGAGAAPTTRGSVPQPGSPLQPGSDGNPQAMPVSQPEGEMPERQAVQPSRHRPAAAAPSDAGDLPHETPATGAEDPGAEDPHAEVKDTPLSTRRAR